MIEILAQLPIELVPELKRVCKWWCYLAKSLSFRNSHFQKCQKVMSGIFIQGPPSLIDGEEPISYTAVDYIAIDKEGKYTVHKNKLDFLPEKVVITASFNGLLVCRGLLYRSIGRIQQPIPPDEELVIYVCNPLTREFSTLKPYISKRERCWIGLAFNSLESSSISFELVVVHYSPMDRFRALYKFKIFSSKTNEWRIAKDLFYYSHRVNFIQSVFLNGIFYWLTEGGTILAFDLKMEKCHIIELPPPKLLFDTTRGMCLGETDGYIHYVCMSYQELRVWILNSGTDSKPEWRMKFFGHVRYGEIVLVDSGSWNRGDLHDGDFISNPTARPRCLKDDVIFMRHGYHFCEFDLKTGNLKQICSFGAFCTTAFHGTIVLPYSTSLVPVCNS